MAHQFVTETQIGPLDRESAAGLVSRLLNDLTHLMRNEVALAKAEFSEVTSSLKRGMAALAIAAVVLLGGLLALLASAILALAQVVAPWLSALIVGVALALVGFLLLQGAKKKLKPKSLDMDRTRTAVRSDAEVIARRI